MHELGIAKDLWDTVIGNARENNLKKITKISIVNGETTGIDAELLAHSFADHLMPGSIANGAELEIITEKIIARCKDCSADIKPEETFVNKCPKCGSFEIDIISGNQTYVKSIEGISCV
jgi:hydrogenase nickel incorporation protein HypA/HybF